MSPIFFEEPQPIVDWAALALRYGTPIVFLSRRRLHQRIAFIQRVFQEFFSHHSPLLFFPIKSNDCMPLLKGLGQFGMGAEISDSVEMESVIRFMDIEPDMIIVNGPAKDDATLEAAVMNEKTIINIDNFSEAHQLARIALAYEKPVKVGIRLRIYDTNKFGLTVDDQEMGELLHLFRECPLLQLVQLHQHHAMVMNSRTLLPQVLHGLVTFAEANQDLWAKTPLRLDLGGGLYDLDAGCDEFATVRDFVAFLAEMCGQYNGFFDRFSLAFEWGQALINGCAAVLTRVARIKRSGGKLWAYCDAGQHILSADYLAPEKTRIHVPGRSDAKEQSLIQVVGPLCFLEDVVCLDSLLPGDLQEGDLLVVEDTGAYTVNTRWHGPGANPVLLLEEVDGHVAPLGRLLSTEHTTRKFSHHLDELYRQFDTYRQGAIVAPEDVIQDVSSGVSNLRPPQYLVDLLVKEVQDFHALQDYVDPRGQEQQCIAAIAFENALAGKIFCGRDNCSIVYGGAQGIACSLQHLYQIGYNRCLIVGPQYPFFHDMARATGYKIHELIGERSTNYIPTASAVVADLCSHEASVVIITTPNNPSGSNLKEDWLRQVFAVLRDSKGHAVIDRTCEDLPFDSRMSFSPITACATDALGTDAFTIISSPSKSRSCPGLRLGYVISDPSLSQYISKHNYEQMMCLPQLGSGFVTVDLVLRSIWWRMHHQGETLSAAVSWTTQQVKPDWFLGIEASSVERWVEGMSEYVEQCTDRCRSVYTAMEVFAENLDSYWQGSTVFQNGFNAIAWLRVDESNPVKLSLDIYHNTGVQLLPGSCFTLYNTPLEAPEGCISFRISAAQDPDALARSAQLIRRFLDQKKTE